MTTMIYTRNNDTFLVENPDKRAITRWVDQLDRQNRFHIRFSNDAGTLSVQGGNFGRIRVGVQLTLPENGHRIGRLISPDYEVNAADNLAVLSGAPDFWMPMQFNVSKETAIEVAAHFSKTGQLSDNYRWEWL